MPEPPVLLDITRLIGRAHRPGPSGIDRLELAYAGHFLECPAYRDRTFAVIHLFGWLFGVHPGSARRFVDAVAARWQGDAPQISLLRLYALLLGGHWMAGWQLRRRLRASSEAPIYLVVSHHHLEHTSRVAKIRRDFSAMVIAFLHDLIPIDYPHFVNPATEGNHQRLLLTVSSCCDAVLVNSQFTAEQYRNYLARSSLPRVPPSIHVAWTGVRDFTPAHPASYARHAPPYFMIIGTIEPKKNHDLLLQVWSELAACTEEVPRLLVIGARGWRNDSTLAKLDQFAAHPGLVEERNHCSDREVEALLDGACAVLVPSLVEGYGLPLAEALAANVPVLCSDILPFREVGGEVPEFLDPQDARAWQLAILEYARPDSARRAAQLERLRHWQKPTWEGHFAVVERAINECSQAKACVP